MFKRNYRSQRAHPEKDFVSEVYEALITVSDNLQITEKLLSSILETTTLTSAITVRKAALIRAAEQISFVGRYSIDILNIAYQYETSEINSESVEFTPYVKKTIIPNIHIFAKLLETYSMPSRDFESKINNIPEVIITADTFSAVSAMFDRDKLEPFSAPITAGFSSSPIYHVRMLVAEWQAERYKSNKDKKRLLEIKLLNLKLSKDNKRDPKLDREIEHLEGRIETLDYKLTKMERDVAYA